MPESATRIGIAIVEHAGRFLVGVRREGSPLPGKAEFPGGKCVEGESSAECAVRECLEEAGLAVAAVRLLDQRVHHYPHGTVELSFWLCEPSSQEGIAEDHHGFRWVDREELQTLDFPEANQRVLELLATGGLPRRHGEHGDEH
jgi:8-oxo-dGTP diphosphatase